METWTQTSNCGCSRKNSVVASSAKSPHHHSNNNNNNSHHRSNNNNNGRHRSSSLRPLQPVELDGQNAPGGDSGGSLSLASLQIRAVRAPTVVASSVAPSDAALSPEAAHAAQGNSKDCPRGETASEFTAVAAGSTNTIPTTNVYAGAGTTTAAAGRQNDARDCLQLQPRRGDLVLTRAVTDTIVTHGHFVSRRPAPGARLRKPPDGQQQQQQRGLRAGRERCWSGGVVTAATAGAPSGGEVSGTSGGGGGGGGGGSVPSATRSRRGKSAGDGKHYCGRPCDACSLQQFQNWVKVSG